MAPLLHHVKVPFLGRGLAESFPNLHAVMVVVRNGLLNRDYGAGVMNGAPRFSWETLTFV